MRLRLFTSSPAQAQADLYNYTNNLDYTLPLALRVKNAGLQFMLDFHYSDTWADPGHQAKPAAWANLTFSQLVAQLRQYSSNCVATFKAAGVTPDYVQVGNEITSGLLWPDGQVAALAIPPRNGPSSANCWPVPLPAFARPRRRGHLRSSSILTAAANTNGQVQYVVALARVLKSVPGGRVIGAFWWGAEYQP